jgi:hypothetical protein
MAHLAFLDPTLRPDIPCPHDQERGHLSVKAHVEKHFPISFRESLATISPGLRNGGRRPAGMVQFHLWVCDLLSVLFGVMSDTDQIVMSLDNQAFISSHIKLDVKFCLGLEAFQQIMGFQKILDRGLKQSGHWVLLKNSGGRLGRPPA